jgi:hypothetical protein
MQTGILERCNILEECYEFMLAYAAKGVPGDGGNGPGSEIREVLERAKNAISGLVESCALVFKEADLANPGKYQAFLAVLDGDADSSLAAIELVLAQPSIGSQLVDNLNASIHLRALLTDLFLIGDILRSRLSQASSLSVADQS